MHELKVIFQVSSKLFVTCLFIYLFTEACLYHYVTYIMEL